MPARSDETERDALLAGAAQAWEAVTRQPDSREAAAGLAVVGDALGFLREYYRLVATEDLTLAGPTRLAAVAARHVTLGAARPQGRPVVSVRPAAVGTLADATTVVDIVTDDMPYLVDSVTMELNRHFADVAIIVHPLLTVSRDVAGTAHGITGTEAEAATGAGTVSRPATMTSPATMASPGTGAVAESWIHVEASGMVSQQQLAGDLRRVLDDLRVAMEDRRRIRGAARELVASLADAALTATSGPEEAEAGEFLAWLSAGHFTFLGYREYDLVRGELRPLPGSGRAATA